ncbi:MAG: hypothetical protein ACOX1T_08195 [Saccharofermentanales bacterium]
MQSETQRILKHRDFWTGKPLATPLVSIRVGDVFISRQFRANSQLLKKNHLVKLEDLQVDKYLNDYEEMYQTHEKVAQDGFFVGEPINGFPWMEAICGCDILGSESSFVSKRQFDCLDDLEKIEYSQENPWYLKYLEFLEGIDRVSAGRFPLGQPILRGVSDTLGALVGQEEMVCGLMIDPDKMSRLFGEVVRLHRSLIADSYRIIKPWKGGYSFGFYYVWAPGRTIWFQEDLAAIMAPHHFNQFLKTTATEICKDYNYSMQHLHPASFGHLEGILSLPFLSAVQINREDVGPSVAEILPQLNSVINAGKKLIILGVLDDNDIESIAANLPHHSIALHAMVPTIDAGNALSERIAERCAAHGWHS